jgi:N-acetylmuramoyl-L-alanine amidase
MVKPSDGESSGTAAGAALILPANALRVKNKPACGRNNKDEPPGPEARAAESSGHMEAGMSTAAVHPRRQSFSPFWSHRAAVAVIALAALSVLAGCPPKARGGQTLAVAEPTVLYTKPSVPMEALAYQLGMRLDNSGQYTASMKGKRNSLLVVGPPQPMALLNSERLDTSGEIGQSDGRLMVSPSLAHRLREKLRLAQGYAPAPPGAPPYLGNNPAHPQPPGAKPAPPAVAVAGPRVSGTVVIDPGHGGKDRGTYSATCGDEKALVLDVSQRIRTILTARGVHVIMTRDDDRFIELEERAEIANRARADLFVAIHADSAPKNTAARGCTVYTARGASAGSESLARRLDAALRPAAVEDRGLRHADYKVLVLTKMPAALIELGFFTNRSEAARLCQSSYRQELAEAIASGIIADLPARK